MKTIDDLMAQWGETAPQPTEAHALRIVALRPFLEGLQEVCAKFEAAEFIEKDSEDPPAFVMVLATTLGLAVAKVRDIKPAPSMRDSVDGKLYDWRSAGGLKLLYKAGADADRPAEWTIRLDLLDLTISRVRGEKTTRALAAAILSHISPTRDKVDRRP